MLSRPAALFAWLALLTTSPSLAAPPSDGAAPPSDGPSSPAPAPEGALPEVPLTADGPRVQRDLRKLGYTELVALGRAVVAEALPGANLQDFPRITVEAQGDARRVTFAARLRPMLPVVDSERTHPAIMIELRPGEPARLTPGSAALLIEPPALARKLADRFPPDLALSVGEIQGQQWVYVDHPAGAVVAFTYDPATDTLTERWHEHPAPRPQLPDLPPEYLWTTISPPPPPPP